MSGHDPQAREHLLELLGMELGKDIGHDDFRMKYEDVFNFGLARASVTEKEFEILERLFGKIVWYSPFPDERARIPNYISESEMEAAVAEARRDLGVSIPGRAKGFRLL